MAWTRYSSADASAPALASNSAGQIIAVLDAVLVDGYGAKAAAGWSKAFSGTNKAAYRQGAPSDSAIQAYLRVLNDGSTSGGNREAQVNAYESMSDVDTGSNEFSGISSVGAGFMRVATNLSATTRDWLVFADERTFVFFADTGDVAGFRFGFYFGDFFSFVSGDQYRQLFINSANTNAATAPHFGHLNIAAQSTTNIDGVWVARDYLGTVGAVNCNKTGKSSWANSGASPALSETSTSVTGAGGNMLGRGGMSRPNPSDGAFLLSPLWINDPTTAPAPSARGIVRGVWQTGHNQLDLGDGDTFSGVGDLAGKTFEVVKIRAWLTGTSASSGCVIMETSDTVPAN